MKPVVWTDDTGRKRRTLIKDTDSEDKARYGIPADPPDIRTIDLEAIFSEIEAMQYQYGLYDWRAVNNSPEGIQACINVFKRKLLELYRNQ